MMIAMIAKFLQHQPIFQFLFVLFGMVGHAVTITAFEFDHVILGHIK